MSQSTLLVSRGARLVTREELDKVHTPPPTGTWFPISHGDVLSWTLGTLEQAGFKLARSQLALSRGAARFFGTIDLENPVAEGVTRVTRYGSSSPSLLPATQPVLKARRADARIRSRRDSPAVQHRPAVAGLRIRDYLPLVPAGGDE